MVLNLFDLTIYEVNALIAAKYKVQKENWVISFAATFIDLFDNLRDTEILSSSENISELVSVCVKRDFEKRN